MTIQKTNDEEVVLLSSHFQRRYEPNFAWGNAILAISMLPGLRGFWPMSGFNASGDAWDVTGLRPNIGYVGNPTYGYEGLAPYIHFDGTGDYLSNVDDAIYDILGTETYVAASKRGISMGGWFYFDNAAGATEFCISKYRSGINDASYALIRNVAGTIRFSLSANGAAVTSVNSTVIPTQSTWTFLAGQYDCANADMWVWVNTETALNAAAPASIWNSGQPFRIGTNGSGGSRLTGRASLCWLCCQYLSDAQIWSVYQQTRALFGV